MHPRRPVLFVSHGAPTFAVEPGLAGQQLAALGRELGQPAAIVVISPHWLTADEIRVSASPNPATIHDFRGFPDELFALDYPAPGAPALAQTLVDMLMAAGWQARLDAHRGLDHGAWVPLRYLAPSATVPVIQVSMPMPMDSHRAWELGMALRPLRDLDVLIVASGSLTHNLYEIQRSSAAGAEYVEAFAQWIASTLRSGDTERLLNYRHAAPGAVRAHPTDEHFLPLLIAVGAAGEQYHARLLPGGITHGVLSMDSYVLQAPLATHGASP